MNWKHAVVLALIGIMVISTLVYTSLQRGRTREGVSEGVTESSLQVISVSPKAGARDVSLNEPLRITFNREIDPAQAGNALELIPRVMGKTEARGNELVFIPTGGWPPSVVIRARLRAEGAGAVRDRQGVALKETFQTSFATKLESAVWSVGLEDGRLSRIARVNGTALGVSVSRDGSRVIVPVSPDPMDNTGWLAGTLWIGESRGGPLRSFGPGLFWSEANDLNGAWSKDGKSILVSLMGDGSAAPGIWLFSLASPPVPLILQDEEGAMKPVSPIWSSDGLMIAYRAYGDWKTHIFVSSPDGKHKREIASFPVRASEYTYHSLKWSPDGSYLTSEEEDPVTGEPVIWRLPVSGGQPVRLVRGYRHSWSPDGLEISYVDEGINVFDVTTSRTRLLASTSGVVRWGPDWSPDGRYIAFEVSENPEDPMGKLWVMKRDGSERRMLTTMNTWGQKCWFPDGKRIAFVSCDRKP